MFPFLAGGLKDLRLSLALGGAAMFATWLLVGEHIESRSEILADCPVRRGECARSAEVLVARLLDEVGPSGRLALLAFAALLVGSALLSIVQRLLLALSPSWVRPDWSNLRASQRPIQGGQGKNAQYEFYSYVDHGWHKLDEADDHHDPVADMHRREAESDMRFVLAGGALVVATALLAKLSPWTWAALFCATALGAHASSIARHPLMEVRRAVSSGESRIEHAVDRLQDSYDSVPHGQLEERGAAHTRNQKHERLRESWSAAVATQDRLVDLLGLYSAAYGPWRARTPSPVVAARDYLATTKERELGLRLVWSNSGTKQVQWEKTT